MERLNYVVNEYNALEGINYGYSKNPYQVPTAFDSEEGLKITKKLKLAVSIDDQTVKFNDKGQLTAAVANPLVEGNGIIIGGDIIGVDINADATNALLFNGNGQLEVGVDGTTIQCVNNQLKALPQGPTGPIFNAGEAIDITGSNISVKYDNTSIKLNTVGQLESTQLAAGDGVEIVGNVIKTKIDGSTITFGANNELVANTSSGSLPLTVISTQAQFDALTFAANTSYLFKNANFTISKTYDIPGRCFIDFNSASIQRANGFTGAFFELSDPSLARRNSVFMNGIFVGSTSETIPNSFVKSESCIIITNNLGITIQNCFFRYFKGAAIAINCVNNNASNAANTYSVACTFQNNKIGWCFYGIVLDADADYSHIINNNIWGTRCGMFVFPSNCIITGNIFSMCPTHIIMTKRYASPWGPDSIDNSADASDGDYSNMFSANIMTNSNNLLTDNVVSSNLDVIVKDGGVDTNLDYANHAGVYINCGNKNPVFSNNTVIATNIKYDYNGLSRGSHICIVGNTIRSDSCLFRGMGSNDVNFTGNVLIDNFIADYDGSGAVNYVGNNKVGGVSFKVLNNSAEPL